MAPLAFVVIGPLDETSRSPSGIAIEFRMSIPAALRNSCAGIP